MKLFDTTWADFFALALPVLAAALAVTAGLMDLAKHNDYAAVFNIGGGLAGAISVVAVYFASKIRDDQMRFWINGIAHVEANAQEGFGS
jgi:ABC-type cobalamin transport system permease subunit